MNHCCGIRYFINSVIIGALTVAIVLTVGPLTAFAFVWMRFAGSQVIFFIIFIRMTLLSMADVACRSVVAPSPGLIAAMRQIDTVAGKILASSYSDVNKFYTSFSDPLDSTGVIRDIWD